MVFLARAARLLVLGIPKGAAHCEVSVHSGHPHDGLHSAAGPLDACCLHLVVWLVVCGEPAIRAAAFYHGAIGTAQEYPAVADVSHPQLNFLPLRHHEGEGSGGAAWLLGLQKFRIYSEHQGLDTGVVGRHGLHGLQLLRQASRHERGALLAAVAVKNAEEAPGILHESHVGILHRRPPTVHLRDSHAEWRPSILFQNDGGDCLWQALPHCGTSMSHWIPSSALSEHLSQRI
mmetsp:Transcript_26403/g.62962  ORF Transcript_26403/g.62962 Transcript_26403/m.62962 type:complete len:232 (+) Transcript_26403:1604-2299(+)